ncbi:mucin-5AC-like, partial [Sinocyclocheilus grahami]|uniref:mucin-5AC-like n=1 Tax=Sinocyclocheilus grahami TaxID=75366 RepID=UPI0007AD6999
MVHEECGNPCINTCSNPDRSHICEDQCIEGCFCPEGYLFDDLSDRGCIAQNQCPCIHNGKIYEPGQTYRSNCKECTCIDNLWSCEDRDCPGTCSVEGGSHITTYDGRTYSFHGDCTYVLSKQTSDNEFTVLGDLMKCDFTDTETCLKAVTLSLSKRNTVFSIQSDGKVFVNKTYSQLPLSIADVMIFKPTTFFIIVQTSFGLELEIQLISVMQVYIKVDATYKQKTNGKFSASCPGNMVYSYKVENNSRSCRCNSDPDFTCGVTFEPRLEERICEERLEERISHPDYCGHANASGTLRVLTENIPCGSTGTTCSKAVRLFLGYDRHNCNSNNKIIYSSINNVSNIHNIENKHPYSYPWMLLLQCIKYISISNDNNIFYNSFNNFSNFHNIKNNDLYSYTSMYLPL